MSAVAVLRARSGTKTCEASPCYFRPVCGYGARARWLLVSFRLSRSPESVQLVGSELPASSSSSADRLDQVPCHLAC